LKKNLKMLKKENEKIYNPIKYSVQHNEGIKYKI